MKGCIADSSCRKHVNADLRPYVCLEPNCLTSEQQYAKRHEWFDHLNQKHWRVFRCPYSCQEADFDSPSQLERHVRQSHPELSSQRDLRMIFDLCERPRPWPEETECPLMNPSEPEQQHDQPTQPNRDSSLSDFESKPSQE